MKVCWFLTIVLSCVFAHSQSFEVESFFTETNTNGKIEGVVFDNEAYNNPLLLADVTIKNYNLATTTNLDGSFDFNIKPGNYTLVFSFIGYKTIEVKNIIVTSNKTTTTIQNLAAEDISFDISSLN
ncbi:MAG: carboxypeptidase-like regulatory domain-containing protein [Lutibacter sp.]|uniref:carboxypeptidase-like regulatory domain-containing protein n=1 Tax=Lutibacter sp. TaxID=1925666 RepID=UPI0038590487